MLETFVFPGQVGTGDGFVLYQPIHFFLVELNLPMYKMDGHAHDVMRTDTN